MPAMIQASPRRLSVFKHVVDLGGFNAAAVRLGIAQPSVGAHGKALERQVGQPLLERRRGARPRLTEAGAAVYDLAVDVVRRSEEASLRLAGLKSKRAREVSIAVHRDLSMSLLPERLAVFSARNPRVRVVTRIGTIEDVLALVRDGAAEVGLVLCQGPVAGIVSEVVGRAPMALVAAPSHPLAGQRSIAPHRLAAFPFVTGLRQSSFFGMMECALKEIGLERFDIAMELQETSAVKEIVRRGRALACVPRCGVAEDLSSGALVELRSSKPLPALEIRCVHGESLSDAGRRLVAALR
jgi:DNA-binding transcriptional LysR family regulator